MSDLLKRAEQLAAYERWFGDNRWTGPGRFDIPLEELFVDLDRNVTPLERFAFEACKTHDNFDMAEPIKVLPNLDYIRFLLRMFLTSRFYLVPKSRRAFATTIGRLYEEWGTLKWPRREAALIPKVGDDGNKQIDNDIKGVLWESHPEWLRARYKLRKIAGTFEVTERDGRPWNSYLVPINQGEHQTRGFGYASVLGDEVCFNPDYPVWFKAMMMTIRGRQESGQFLGISSLDDSNAGGQHFIKQCGPRLSAAILVARGELLAEAA